MTSITKTCVGCGVSLRVPEPREPSIFRCPKCGEKLRVAPSGPQAYLNPVVDGVKQFLNIGGVTIRLYADDKLRMNATTFRGRVSLQSDERRVVTSVSCSIFYREPTTHNDKLIMGVPVGKTIQIGRTILIGSWNCAKSLALSGGAPVLQEFVIGYNSYELYGRGNSFFLRAECALEKSYIKPSSEQPLTIS